MSVKVNLKSGSWYLIFKQYSIVEQTIGQEIETVSRRFESKSALWTNECINLNANKEFEI